MDSNLPQNPPPQIPQPIAQAALSAKPQISLNSKQSLFSVFSDFSLEKRIKFASLSIRFGLAFVFAFAAFSEYVTPQDYLQFIPSFVTNIIPGDLFLRIYEAFEVLLALWLLSGKFLIVSATISFLTILSLTFANLGVFSILFRNIAIIFGAIGLMILSSRPKAV